MPKPTGYLSDLFGLDDERIRTAIIGGGLIIAVTLVALGLAPKIDQSLATLIVGIVGVYSVAHQARVGFANLIEAQKQRGQIEAEARIHQHSLAMAASNEQRIHEVNALASGLAGEIFGIMRIADSQRQLDQASATLFGAFKGNPEKKTNIPTPQFSSEVYDGSVSKIGILGASVAGDVVKVYSSKPYLTDNENIKMEVAEMLLLARAVYLSSWVNDLAHVHQRLMAFVVPGLRDPGPLPLTSSSEQPSAAASS